MIPVAARTAGASCRPVAAAAAAAAYIGPDAGTYDRARQWMALGASVAQALRELSDTDDDEGAGASPGAASDTETGADADADAEDDDEDKPDQKVDVVAWGAVGG